METVEVSSVEAHFLILITGLFSLAGALSSFYISLILHRISRTIGDKGLALYSLAMAVFGLSLLIEAAVNILAPIHITRPGRRPQEILVLLVNRGTLIAIPLYTLSYSFMAASHYVSSTDTGNLGINRVLTALLPVLVLVFVDYNLIDLIVLIIASAAVLGKYGVPRLPAVAFYIVLGISHSIAASILFLEGKWWVIPLSTTTRSLAPLLLLALLKLSNPGEATGSYG